MVEEQLLRRNVKRFQGGLVFKADILAYNLTLGSRVIDQIRSTKNDLQKVEIWWRFGPPVKVGGRGGR